MAKCQVACRDVRKTNLQKDATDETFVASAENAVVRENCKSVASQQNYFLVFRSEIAEVCRTANLRLGDKIILVVLLLHADVPVANQREDFCDFWQGKQLRMRTANLCLVNKIIT